MTVTKRERLPPSLELVRGGPKPSPAVWVESRTCRQLAGQVDDVETFLAYEEMRLRTGLTKDKGREFERLQFELFKVEAHLKAARKRLAAARTEERRDRARRFAREGRSA